MAPAGPAAGNPVGPYARIPEPPPIRLAAVEPPLAPGTGSCSLRRVVTGFTIFGLPVRLSPVWLAEIMLGCTPMSCGEVCSALLGYAAPSVPSAKVVALAPEGTLTGNSRLSNG